MHKMQSTTLKSTSIAPISNGQFPQQLRRKAVAFEGLIGVGKTTLTQAVQKANANDVSVYGEQINQEFLKMFYKDPAKYGWALQWGQLQLRLHQLELVKRDKSIMRKPPMQLGMWDRSLIGDYCFALWNYLSGSITEDEIRVYEKELEQKNSQSTFHSLFANVDIFLFLDDEPANCRLRVNARGNEAEKDIPIEYYNGLDHVHFYLFQRLLSSSRVGVLHFGQYNSAECVVNYLAKLLELPQHTAQDVCNIKYETPAQINEDYSKLYAKQNSVLDCTYMHVSFDKNIMRLTPESVGVVQNHHDDIPFYENAYRRLVYYWISRGATVSFF